MKSYLRLALIASLLPSCVYAHRASPDGVSPPSPGADAAHGAQPPYADAHRELMAFLFRYEKEATRPSPLVHGTTRTFLAEFLENPASHYSELKAYPAITNARWWPGYAERVATGYHHRNQAALAMLQRQLGLTKAHPGRDVREPGAEDTLNYRTRGAAANAIKAGVDPDIFLKAWDMNGVYPSVAAGYAVALQIVRDRSASVPVSQHGRQALKPEVVTRYLSTRSPERLDEQDLRYLTQVLRAALHSPPDPDRRHRRRHLPAAFRVARVAAAYQDAAGYVSNAICVRDRKAPGMPDGVDATIDHRPLCFTDATDRAVHAWYRRQLRRELSAAYLHRDHHNGFAELVHWAGAVMVALDVGAFVEVVEAAVADEAIASADLLDESAASLAFPDIALDADDEALVADSLANASRNRRALHCRISP